MSTTQPIRSRELLHVFKDYYRLNTPNLRNYTLIVMGLNTALRISDILNLKWEDVLEGKQIRRHVTVRERKTGKENRILLNDEVRKVLRTYHSKMKRTALFRSGNPYVFPSPVKEGSHLSRFQAYRVIRAAAEHLGLEGHISCHSLRKTFGYHAWKQGVQPALLMNIYNHSSYRITVRYLCIEQDDRDEVFRRIRL